MPSCAADDGGSLAAHPITGHGPAASRPVLLCGYYGEHNLGDDALLEALLGQLPAGVTPLVTAHDETQVQARFGVATVPRRRLKAVLAALGRCRALVLGGGSLLQDATSFRSLLYYAALILAARRRGLPVQPSALIRHRDTAMQSTLTSPEREPNVRGAFRAVMPLPRHVALIDDVFTTGATCRAAREALFAAGVQQVDVWCLARVT